MTPAINVFPTLKVSGGLTRGRGMDEAKRLSWLLSLSSQAALNHAVQNFTNLQIETSEQHKECGESRFMRDHNDTGHIYNFLRERNPFISTNPNEFRNIADGIISTSKTNVDRANEIGLQIIRSLEDKNVFEHSFERKKQVVQMSSRNELVLDGEMVLMDSDTLFQRLLLLLLQSDRSEIEKKSDFGYELCHKAPSLFDEWGFMREANSSTLLKSILKRSGTTIDTSHIQELSDVVYVVEGEWLIQKISWSNGEVFGAICDRQVILQTFSLASQIIRVTKIRTKCKVTFVMR